MTNARVVAVSRDEVHRFSKTPVASITLVAGLGVLGDAHAGTLVQHRSRVRRDPNQPNLRQVHLLHEELFAEAEAFGYDLRAGDLGENVLTQGLDLLGLPTGTLLDFDGPAVRLTGLRNPCAQINDFRPGLLKVVLSRADGTPSEEPAPSTGSPGFAAAALVPRDGEVLVTEPGSPTGWRTAVEAAGLTDLVTNRYSGPAPRARRRGRRSRSTRRPGRRSGAA